MQKIFTLPLLCSFLAIIFEPSQSRARQALLPNQATWTKEAAFPSSSRNYGLGFSINNKGYYGMGQKQSKPFIYKAFTDLWEYDPETKAWTQKSDFPGAGRLMAKGFSINNKIYIGFGYIISAFGSNAGSNEYQTDLYEFDPATNQWSKKNESLLGRGDIFFVIRDNAYAVNPEYRALNKYNALTDTWFEMKWEKAEIAPDYGDITGDDINFSALEKEYLITTVRRKDTLINQLWELDPHSITWKQKNNLPLPGYDTVSVFTSGEKIYAIRGGNEVLQYNTESDVWTRKKNMALENKDFYHTFSIRDRSYGFSKYEFGSFIP
jgi:N-acetylneuraminic acid mutarotase